MQQYQKLFEPIKIGNVEIKNKIAMAPMGIIGLNTERCGFSKRAQDYYVERAKGGTGLIITGVAKIENEIEKFHPGSMLCPTVDPGHFIATAGEMVERVHAYDSKIFLQLGIGFGRVAAPQMLASEPVAPSAIPNYWDPRITCRELTTAEVERLVKMAAESAAIAKAAGFDGVEIHAVHEGYLLDQFTIGMFNKRNDKYGGDLMGRLRLPIEIVQAIKHVNGKNFPVVLRFSIKSYIKDWNQGGLDGEEFVEKGRDTQEGLTIAPILEKAGYDGFDADAGSYDAWYWAHPPIYQKHGLYLPLTEQLKQVVHVPVIVAGKMDIPEFAEKTLEEGKAADMVSLGRGLLADPDWGNKVLEGRPQDIRPCIGCHDGCMGRAFLGKPLSCAVNPACGREEEYGFFKADEPKNIIVVGGGIAGMEVARVATLRGHKVTLFEKTDKLGGHLVEGSVDEFKKDNARLLEWYRTQMQELNVDIRLNTEVKAEDIKNMKADAVIVATGSIPAKPNIPGIDKSNVATATEVLLKQKPVGQNVVVVGGGLVGCETAISLAMEGKNVTIVEMLPSLMGAGQPVPHMNKIMVLDMLRRYNVNTILNTSVLEIKDGSVELIDKNFKTSSLSTDTVVLSAGMKANSKLFKDIASEVPNTYAIGDANSARNIMYAIWDAYEVARNI
ncbi:FAD-dependent oxidoreductase [Coprothermobacter platensis]|uniref:oxidoreductase n=1 Tax=Coprothermobacter platensis TaxID=108819 RepID=UPI0003770AB4|nr:FAD-dependent oxidoreductase [Coprothermobacter platensis]